MKGINSQAKRLKLRMLGTREETCAALDAKDAEIERLRSGLQEIADLAASCRTGPGLREAMATIEGLSSRYAITACQRKRVP